MAIAYLLYIGVIVLGSIILPRVSVLVSSATRNGLLFHIGSISISSVLIFLFEWIHDQMFPHWEWYWVFALLWFNLFYALSYVLFVPAWMETAEKCAEALITGITNSFWTKAFVTGISFFMATNFEKRHFPMAAFVLLLVSAANIFSVLLCAREERRSFFEKVTRSVICSRLSLFYKDQLWYYHVLLGSSLLIQFLVENVPLAAQNGNKTQIENQTDNEAQNGNMTQIENQTDNEAQNGNGAQIEIETYIGDGARRENETEIENRTHIRKRAQNGNRAQTENEAHVDTRAQTENEEAHVDTRPQTENEEAHVDTRAQTENEEAHVDTRAQTENEAHVDTRAQNDSVNQPLNRQGVSLVPESILALGHKMQPR